MRATLKDRAASLMLIACMGTSRGYLMVALPQSSSTATMYDLGAYAALPVKQDKDLARSQLCTANISYRFLGIAGHSDTCLVRPEALNSWHRSSTYIFKQHTPPMNATIDQLVKSNARVIILTRNPFESLHAACERAAKEGRLDDATDQSLLSLRVHALIEWLREWRAAAVTHSANFHEISFELMEQCGRERVLASALQFWKVPFTIPKDYKESKARYVHHDTDVCSRALNSTGLTHLRDVFELETSWPRSDTKLDCGRVRRLTIGKFKTQA